jgi:parvulin-like peptidyl-prolyl isomerase
LGLDEKRVQDEVALTLAWNQHATRTIADAQIREYWKAHERRLDGTRLRVSQIVLKYEPGESPKSAPKTTAKLKLIRDRIVSGKKSFADAARDVSQSPSAEQGGDVGVIGPRGDLPEAVSQAAYKLGKGDVSDIVLSPFGAHLVTVTALEPGDLSLEDARPAIFKELAEKLWRDTVASERKMAKIVLPRE